MTDFALLDASEELRCLFDLIFMWSDISGVHLHSNALSPAKHRADGCRVGIHSEKQNALLGRGERAMSMVID